MRRYKQKYYTEAQNNRQLVKRVLYYDHMAEYTQSLQSSTASTDPRGKKLMDWAFDEHEHTKRSLQWYIITSLIAIGLIVYGIMDNNYLFVLIIILIAFIYYVQSRNTPLRLTFALYQTGIQIGETFYLYRELKNFAVVYEPPLVKRLYFEAKNMSLRNEISIPLLDQNPIKVRKILLDFLPENLDKEEESVSDAASRALNI